MVRILFHESSDSMAKISAIACAMGPVVYFCNGRTCYDLVIDRYGNFHLTDTDTDTDMLIITYTDTDTDTDMKKTNSPIQIPIPIRRKRNSPIPMPIPI